MSTTTIRPSKISIWALNPHCPQFAYEETFLSDLQLLMRMSEYWFYAALLAMQEEKDDKEKRIMQEILQCEIVNIHFVHL